MTKSEHWTSQFFSKLYWELFMKRNEDELAHEMKIISQIIQFKPKSVLDVCCGVGDILEQFSQSGVEKTLGIEWSDDYVNNSYIDTVVKGDACEKNTNEKFDLVLNWYSSFAYFDKGNDLKMLQNCFNATKKMFVLEIFNSYHILANFKESLSYEKIVGSEKYDIVRNSIYNPVERKLQQEWVYGSNGDNLRYNTSVNLYFLDEIIHLLKSVGFKNVNFFSYDGKVVTDFLMTSPRIVFVAYPEG